MNTTATCRHCGHTKTFHPWVFCRKDDCRCPGWYEIKYLGEEEE